MIKCGKRLLALVLTVVMVLSCISPAVSATAVEPDGHTHENPVLLSTENPSYVTGPACYVQYDLNNDGVLSGKDAVELLGRATNPDVYQGEQIDVDRDGDFDTQDAIALLKIALWPEKNGYVGNIHAFGEPVWQWNEDGTAVAKFQCACGQEKPEIPATVTEPVVKKATCTEAGSVSVTASVEFLDTPYTNNKVTVSPATGHAFDAEADCTTSAACTKCDYVMPASGHNYVKTAEQAADCTHEATETYTCSVCQDSYTVKTGGLVHTYVYSGETLKEGETCVYVQVLKCSQCEKEIPGETVEHHKYKAAVTREPTCQATGVKTYTCTECGDSYTESIPATAEGHNWVADSENGEGAYKCSICDATKTVVVATDNKVSADDLKQGGEVQLADKVSVTLDEATAGNLTGELTLNVSKVDKDTVEMDPNYKEDSTIYNLTMEADGEAVTNFAGEVTVKLPYELQEGDDVDCIQVLYVDNEGKVKEIEGHYSNGYVIFTTTHFSYYTVTRLTPAQRCKLYGHNDNVTAVAATCENGGYTVRYCARCGRVEKDDLVDALGHDYQITESKATCTAAGSMTKECSRCDSSVTENYPALGHSWSVETVEATCSAPGSETKTCALCRDKQSMVLPQLAHKITDTVVPATCTEQGYTTHTCANCDYNLVDSATAPLGHQYVAEWTWDESNYSAKVTLTCAVCKDTVTADAAVTETANPATCGVAGSEFFEASYSYAGQIYTDSVTTQLEALDHAFGPWEADGKVHTRVCARCDEKETAAHVWDEGKLTKEPTCSQEGLRVYTCLVCGAQENEVVAVTGEHNLENGVCIDCGFRVDECTHENLRLIEQKIQCGNCVHTLSYLLCECGQCMDISGLSPAGEDVEMEWTPLSFTQTDANTLERTDSSTCTACGLTETFTDVMTSTGVDPCVGKTSSIYTVTGDGVETVTLTMEGEAEHPFTRLIGQYDLAKYGFCGGVVNVVSCACGQEGTLDIAFQCKMGFRWDEETETLIYFCPQCEHSCTDSHSPEGEPQNCIQKVIETVRFLDADGTPVLTLQQPMYRTDHEQPRYEFKMLGESCEDGVFVTTYCDACGAVEKDNRLYTEHVSFKNIIDVSGHGLCTDTLERYSCPCGEEQWTDLWNGDHKFESYYDDKTETDTLACMDCDLRVHIRHEILSENGCYQNVIEHFVAMADGVELASWEEAHQEGNHDFIARSIKPLTDAGCLGRVEVTERCTKCGFEHTWTTDGSGTDENGVVQHCTFVTERIDLKELDLCGGELIIYECACGENYYVGMRNVGCFRGGAFGDPDGWEYTCDECGARWKHEVEYPESDDCIVKGKEALSITMDGKEVFHRAWAAQRVDHDYHYAFELNGTTCAEGGWVIATCQKCDVVDRWGIETEWHAGYPIEQVTTPENVCPGTIYVISCPCGAEGWIDRDLSCNWADITHGPTEDGGWVESGRCRECGASYELHGWDDVEVNGCYHTSLRTYTYKDRDGKEFFSREMTQIEQRHEFTYQVELDGNSCTDGYTVTETCKNCDWTDTFRFFNHDDFSIEQDPINLADHGFCGGILHITSCPCGQNQNSWWEATPTSCRWNYVEETEKVNDDGSVTVVRLDRCEECDATKTRTRVERFTGDDSCDVTFHETTVYRSSKGEEFTVQSAGRSERHDREYSYKLLGETCEDGVKVTEVCTRCQQTIGTYTQYWHGRYPVQTFTNPENVCEGTITVYACACGEVHDLEESGCNFRSEDHGLISDNEERSTYKCVDCGSVKEIRVENDAVIQGCKHINHEVYSYRNADGQEYFSKEFNSVRYFHDYVATAQLHGATCDDGYTVTERCKNCDKIQTWEGRGHNSSLIEPETIDLKNHGFCGGIIRTRGCPCGKIQSSYYEYTDGCCAWLHDGETSTDKSDGSGYITVAQYHCEKCQSTRTQTVDVTYKADGSCNADVTETNVYRNEGEEFPTVHTYPTSRHKYQSSYTRLGESCEDGVRIQEICKRCGDTLSERTIYRHETYPVETIDLSGLPCGGTYVCGKCACGQETFNDCRENCQWEDAGYDEATGMSLFICGVPGCGAHKAISRQETSPENSCNHTSQEHVVLTDAQGNVVLDRVFEYANVYHDFILESATAEGDNCENGFTAVLECSRCGKITTDNGNWHRIFQKKIDLEPKRACAGTYMVEEICPCGREKNVYIQTFGCNNDYDESELQINDDGTVTWTTTQVCRDCGLRREGTYTGERNPQNCEISGNHHEVISLNGEVLIDKTSGFCIAKHTGYHYEYPEGVSCTDGIEYRLVCDRCGQVQGTGTVNNHNTFVKKQEIDLSQYGAACGGKLIVYRCLCGSQQRVERYGDYCDFDRQACDLWVDDAVPSGSYYNPESDTWRHLESCAYDLICAVSDPEPCGFRIRVADYWREVPDNPCLLQNVQIWRIGYDPNTDTWQEEITVLGEIVCNHAMTETEETTTNDLGQRVVIRTLVCGNCGTTSTGEEIYENNFLINRTVNFVNGLVGDGLSKSSTEECEYLTHGNHTHQTHMYRRYVTQTGEEYWREYTDFYDFENCTRRSVETNSNGDRWEYIYEEAHCRTYEYLILAQPTCSQFGEAQHWVCSNCDWQETYLIDPTCHSWRYDPETGIYSCDACHLESAVGATGSVVMEDMTERNGDGTNFVIGYWNQNDIPVSCYVSVVLYDVTEEMDADQVLSDIQFIELERERDGITAIAFDKAETLRLAQEKVNELGYTGSYDIRFTFVPQDGTTTLDYAITLPGVAA